MKDFDIYMNLARGVQSELLKEINAYIKFEIYVEIDTVIFKITFKGFRFHYAMDDVSNKVMNGESYKDLASDILTTYKNAILSAFFKTEERKMRDKKTALFEDIDDYYNVTLEA